MRKILYHGSLEIISTPMYGQGKVYNDYGQGFYCTESLELAKEWSCAEREDGYVNQYEMDETGLLILNLMEKHYSVLHWLAILMKYRKIRLSSAVMKRGREWLLEHFLPDVDGYDVVIGYRADDSYFSFARAFVNNEISLEQLSYAMRLGKLGEQYVLKSQKAFQAIHFLSYEGVDSVEYYVKRRARDEKARNAYRKKVEEDDIDGIYMRDLIRGEVSAEDERLWD